MERAFRIANLWNWLPAFRTVAETQHLPSAARALHVSPSALSRSVKQLEHQLGFPLFERDGRAIRLNRAGQQLLVAVRDAMRRVDDGIDAPTERIRIAGPVAWLQLIALPALWDGERQLPVELVADSLGDVARSLLCGDVDVVLAEHDGDDDRIAIEHLGAIDYAVCTARGAGDDLPCAVWTAISDGRHPRPDAVVLRSSQLPVILEACRVGAVHAVLPVAIARAHGLDARRTPALPPGQLYLTHRRPLAASPLDELVRRLGDHARRVLGGEP